MGRGVGEQVISQRFWIHWAVALPLTLMTIIPWIVWTRRKNSTYRLQLVRAKEKFNKDVQGLGEDKWNDGEVKLENPSHSPAQSPLGTSGEITYMSVKRRSGIFMNSNENDV